MVDDLEQRARELLAEEYVKEGFPGKAFDLRSGVEPHRLQWQDRAALHAITRARQEALEEAAKVADSFDRMGFKKETARAIATAIRTLNPTGGSDDGN